MLELIGKLFDYLKYAWLLMALIGALFLSDMTNIDYY